MKKSKNLLDLETLVAALAHLSASNLPNDSKRLAAGNALDQYIWSRGEEEIAPDLVAMRDILLKPDKHGSHGKSS